VTFPAATMDIQEEISKDLAEKAHKDFNTLKEKWIGVNDSVQFSLGYGPAVNSIEDFALENKVDLIIMGTHKVSGFSDFIFGNHTEKMVAKASIPILFLNKFMDPHSIKEIIFPNSLELNQHELVNRIKELQELFNAQLKVLYINTPEGFRKDSETREAMRQFVAYYGIENYTLNIFNDQDEESGIVHFAQGLEGGLVALSTHGRRGINAFLNGSITRYLVNHMDYPIWTVLQK
jgi:nucleotide-binding universal stress UspA family protein